MILRFLCVLFFISISTIASAEGYYYKGKFIALDDKKVLSADLLQYTKQDNKKIRFTNKIILKTLHPYEDDYFKSKYGLRTLKHYGKVFVLAVEDIHHVLDLCKQIYESESVVYVQPSFIKRISPNRLVFENLKASKRPLTPKVISHSNEDTKSMLDAEDSVNYYKYYDDVFRYQDESFWHLHNKGGFITQAFYQGEFFDVLSPEQVD